MAEVEMLTELEHEAMDLTAQLSRTMRAIIGDGLAAEGDVAEMVAAVHVLQRMILSQAAARAYPDRYRPLGGNAPGDPQPVTPRTRAEADGTSPAPARVCQVEPGARCPMVVVQDVMAALAGVDQ